MIIPKIDSTGHHKNMALALTHLNAHKPVDKKAVNQITPAQSAMELAKAELGTDIIDLDNLFPSDEALYEAQENIGIAMGSQLNSGRSGQGSVADRSRPRSMVQRLARQVASTAPDQLESLRERIAAVIEVEEVDDLLNSMKRHKFDLGEMALLLGSMLNEKGLTTKRRNQLEQALNGIMDDEDWVLQLFGKLEFGAINHSGLAELRRLYQRAASRKSGLTYWFSQFRQLKDRQRKLKTLIRALAFELSAEQNISDIHLAAVITDLKRILQFMAIEDHSQRVANELQLPEVDGDRITEELLEIAQQAWVYSDWLYDRASQLLPEGHSQHGYARRMSELVKLLSDECFEDIEQRETVMQAFLEYQERLADED